MLVPGTAVRKTSAATHGLGNNGPFRHECGALAEAKRENHKTQRSKADGCLERGRMPMFAKATTAFDWLNRSTADVALPTGGVTMIVSFDFGLVVDYLAIVLISIPGGLPPPEK